MLSGQGGYDVGQEVLHLRVRELQQQICSLTKEKQTLSMIKTVEMTAKHQLNSQLEAAQDSIARLRSQLQVLLPPSSPTLLLPWKDMWSWVAPLWLAVVSSTPS